MWITTLVFVRAVVMKAIPATARRRVIDRDSEVVAAEKPIERTPGFAGPGFIESHSECFQAGRDHGLGLDGLLVEFRTDSVFFVESVTADRAEMSGRGFLLFSQPAQTLESDFECPWMGNQAATEDQCLAEPGVVIGDAVFEPRPIAIGAGVPSCQEFFGEQIAGDSGFVMFRV